MIPPSAQVSGATGETWKWSRPSDAGMNRLADALDRALAERDRARDLAAALEAVNAQLRADRDELRYALATAMCSTEGCHGDGCAVCQPPGASS